MHVFARFNAISRAIRTDYDARTDEETESAAFLPLRWNSVALSILSLPVPVRDEPLPVSGEIDTARTKLERKAKIMTTPLDDMFGGFDDDLDPNAGLNTRPDLGRGLYTLSRYYPKKTTKQGNIVVAEFLVVQPPNGGEKKPGDMVSVAWFVSKVGIAGRYEKARAAGFVRALLGLPEKSPDGKNTDTGPHARKLTHETQPGTGLLIVINGEANGEYRNYRFEHVPGQTPEKIKAMRDRVTSAANYTPPNATNATPAQPAPPPAPPPAPTPAPAAAPTVASPLDAIFGGTGVQPFTF